MKVNVKVNGQNKVFHIEPGDYLLDTLRKEDYLSVKKGCDNSSCGVCTVLFDGKPIKSCSLLTAKTEGHEVTTVEGIQKEADKCSLEFKLLKPELLNNNTMEKLFAGMISLPDI